MSNRIVITLDGEAFEAELDGSETAEAFAAKLPLEFSMSRWGEEYYGDIGAKLGVSMAADARTEMAVGELAYWLPGNALCIFFGPTPASVADEPRAASEVNPIGRITKGVERLHALGGSVRATCALR